MAREKVKPRRGQEPLKPGEIVLLLRYQRKHKLIQEELAKLIGLKGTTLYDMLGGENSLSRNKTLARTFIREVVYPEMTGKSSGKVVSKPELDKAIDAAQLVLGAEGAFCIDLLLKVLEAQLKQFILGPVELRELLRKRIDPNVFSRVGSILAMLPDEGKFSRWKQVGAYGASGFLEKGETNGKKG